MDEQLFTARVRKGGKDMKFCTECGNKLSEGVKFCPICGSAVAAPAAPEAATKKKSGINWKLLTILLIVGALIIGAGVAVIVDIVDDGEFNLYGLLDSDTSTDDDDDEEDEDDETDPTGTTGPAAPVQQETRYCEYCGQNVVWQPWTSTTSLPTVTGHFYLAEDVELTNTASMLNVTLCLDLNGKSVRQTVEGNQVYKVRRSVLNIMDSSASGSGVIYPASVLNENKGDAWGQGINIGCYSQVNLYGGTIDASNITAKYSCCVHISAGAFFNMYGGKLIGGTTWGSGGTVLVAQGTFCMHAGEIIGGHVESTHVIGGGGAIRVADTATIYGGSITGGSTNMDGGNIRVGEEGFLFIGKDAVVSGGQADGEGDNIFVQAGGEYVHGTGDILSGVYFENTAY